MTILSNPEPAVSAITCRSHGDGWSCDKPIKYKSLQLCIGHYNQHRQGRELTKIEPHRVRRPVERHDPNDFLCRIPYNHKRCTECGEIKPLSCFHKRRESTQDRCKECHSDYLLDWRFGVGTAQWKKERLAEQGNLCALCKSPEMPVKHPWHLDHDHETGELRGVLCYICNVSLGHMEHGWNHAEFAARVGDYIKTGGESVRPSCTSHRESSSSEAFE